MSKDNSNSSTLPKSINDLLRPANSRSREEVEHEVSLDGITMNIRMSQIQSGNRKGELVPNVWLRRKIMDEEGNDTKEREAFMFFPLVDDRYSASYGGHNASSFKAIFGPVLEALRGQKMEQLREAAPVAEIGGSIAPVNGDDDIPF